MEVKNNENNKCIEEIILEFRIRLNKRLYDNDVITLEIYQKMENYLITKLNKLHNNYIRNK